MMELDNVSMSTLPLRDVIPAAGAAGFTSMSILARPHSKCGMTDAELAALLADNGIAVHDVEASGDWLEPPAPRAEAWLNSVYDTEQLLAVADALGATTLVAVHFGPARPPDASAEAFAALCDRAGEHGLRVALEFPAIATIGDLGTAWQVVQDADRANGGLLIDLWHHRRSGSDDALLASIPADRIHSVQLSDGAAEPEGTLLEDLQRRRLPGEGDFDVVAFIRQLDAMGVTCPIGIEVFDAGLIAKGAPDAARVLHDALAGVVAEARS